MPFMLSISLRGAETTACHEALQILAYSGTLKMLGLRLRPERVQQSNAARDLTEAYRELPSRTEPATNSYGSRSPGQLGTRRMK